MPITNEHLTDIDEAFDKQVLKEIFNAYKAQGSTPSAKVLAALGRVYGKTARELEEDFHNPSVKDLLF